MIEMTVADERLSKQLGLALEALDAIADGEGTAQVIAQQTLDQIVRVGMEAIALAELEAREAPDTRQNISDVLIEALEPFALEASEYDCLSEIGEFGPDHDDAPNESSLNEINGLKVGDLRRARDALRQAKGEAR